MNRLEGSNPFLPAIPYIFSIIQGAIECPYIHVLLALARFVPLISFLSIKPVLFPQVVGFTALSGTLAKKLVENLGAGRHGDRNGLYLVIDPSGARCWIVDMLLFSASGQNEVNKIWVMIARPFILKFLSDDDRFAHHLNIPRPSNMVNCSKQIEPVVEVKGCALNRGKGYSDHFDNLQRSRAEAAMIAIRVAFQLFS